MPRSTTLTIIDTAFFGKRKTALIGKQTVNLPRRFTLDACDDDGGKAITAPRVEAPRLRIVASTPTT